MTTVAVDASCLGWPSSGTRRYVERVVRGLAEDARLEIVLITNERTPVSSIPGAREVPRRVKSGVVWRSTAFVLEARRAHADVAWLPWPALPALPLPCPAVVTVHDVSPLLHPGTKPWISTAGMAVFGRRAVRRAARTICVSETTRRDVQRLWNVPPTRTVAIPHAADERFAPVDRPEAQARVAGVTGVSAPYLLAVGSIEPRKGYDLLPSLARELPDLPIVVAGRPGPLSSSLLQELSRTCCVVGEVPDALLRDLYAGAELVLVPSLYEGFGLTPLEALACGTPAIVARGSGALEAALEGVMPVVERDPAAWAREVRHVIADRAALVRRGQELVSRRTWDDVVHETAAVLLQAAAEA